MSRPGWAYWILNCKFRFLANIRLVYSLLVLPPSCDFFTDVQLNTSNVIFSTSFSCWLRLLHLGSLAAVLHGYIAVGYMHYF